MSIFFVFVFYLFYVFTNKIEMATNPKNFWNLLEMFYFTSLSELGPMCARMQIHLLSLLLLYICMFVRVFLFVFFAQTFLVLIFWMSLHGNYWTHECRVSVKNVLLMLT